MAQRDVSVDVVEAQFEQGEYVAAVLNAAVQVVAALEEEREVFGVLVRRYNGAHVFD